MTTTVADIPEAYMLEWNQDVSRWQIKATARTGWVTVKSTRSKEKAESWLETLRENKGCDAQRSWWELQTK